MPPTFGCEPVDKRQHSYTSQPDMIGGKPGGQNDTQTCRAFNVLRMTGNMKWLDRTQRAD